MQKAGLHDEQDAHLRLCHGLYVHHLSAGDGGIRPADGASFEANIGSLVLAILGKMVMSLGWASLYTFLNVVFRRYFGISVALSFFFGTGILIIGVAAVLGSSPILNLFLYGSSVNACLRSNIVTLLTCIVVSAAWAVIYNLAGTLLLKKSDVY